MAKLQMRREWSLYITLGILIVHLIAIFLWSNHIMAVPLKQKISIAPAGVIEKYIEIPIHDRYRLMLKFKREGHEFEELKSLIGMRLADMHNFAISSGIKIPILLELTNSKTNEILFFNEIESVGAHSWTRDEVGRIITNIQIKPGKYKLKARITKPVPEFKNIETYLELSLDFKNGTNWRVGYVWLGTILSFFIIPILIFLIISMELSLRNKTFSILVNNLVILPKLSNF